MSAFDAFNVIGVFNDSVLTTEEVEEEHKIEDQKEEDSLTAKAKAIHEKEVAEYLDSEVEKKETTTIRS